MVNVSGQVINESRNPIPDVLVVFGDGRRITANTGPNGMFSVDVPRGNYTVKTIHSNYQTYTDQIDVPVGGELEITMVR